MKKIAWKGIVLGGVVDIVSTNILSIPLLTYIMSGINHHGLSKDQLVKEVAATIQANPVYYSIQMLVGGACSILGGYVAAKIAKHDEMLNGMLSSFLCVGGTIYIIVTTPGNDLNLMKAVMELPLSPMLGLLGGYLCLRRRKQVRT